MKRMLIYIFAPAGCLVLRESPDFNIQAWFDSRQRAFRLLGITRIEWEVI